MNEHFAAPGVLVHVKAGEGSGEHALRDALANLFAIYNFPNEIANEELLLCRDTLGKPFVAWNGRLAEWARDRKLSDHHLHVSNSHDGGRHFVLAAYGENIVGLGVDAVHMPRFQKIGKDIPYLHRFAGHFMNTEELALFQQAVFGEEIEAIRIRVAAHFSLMEAASKACGTGLKMGAGMGTHASLAKHELGVKTLGPPVELLFGHEAECRIQALGVRQWNARWETDNEFLISLVTFHR